MKRLVLLAVITALLLCACAPGKPSAPLENADALEATVEPEQPRLEPEPEETAQQPAADENAALLTALLQTIKAHYQPGTAGCSLQAARFAGQLLDWNAEAHPDAETVTIVTAAFYQTLDGEAAVLFSGEQLPGVYEAARALLEENALDYLESAGYQPVSYPWSADTVDALFAALFDGIGRELPA